MSRLPRVFGATILSATALMSFAGCAAGTAGDPYTSYSTAVRLKDGSVVDCVTDLGVDCDWAHPRKARTGERTREAKYYRLNGGMVVPCFSTGGRTSNGTSCDFQSVRGVVR